MLVDEGESSERESSEDDAGPARKSIRETDDEGGSRGRFHWQQQQPPQQPLPPEHQQQHQPLLPPQHQHQQQQLHRRRQQHHRQQKHELCHPRTYWGRRWHRNRAVWMQPRRSTPTARARAGWACRGALPAKRQATSCHWARGFASTFPRRHQGSSRREAPELPRPLHHCPRQPPCSTVG